MLRLVPWTILWPSHLDPDFFVTLSGYFRRDFGLDVPCRGLFMLGLCLG